MRETSPVGVAFDMQRQAIEQTNDLFTRSIETQREFGEALADFGPVKQAHQQQYEAVHAMVDTYFEALEATIPGQKDLIGDARETVDDQLETLEATQTQAIDSIESNVLTGQESTEELLEEFVATLDRQFEAIRSAHEDIEDRTVETVDDLEDTLEELRTEFEAHGEEAAESFSSQLAAFETQITTIQEQIEELTADLTERVDEQASDQLDAMSESIESISGLGPTYAERLQENGIESMKELADANVDLVAEVADVSTEQATTWIESARSWA